MEEKRKVHGLWKELAMDMRPGVRYWHPAAAMDEADLREEVHLLAARGFGRIEAVVLGFRLPAIAPDEEWGTAKWRRMMEILADETGKQRMSLDITNGPEWPISSSKIASADDAAALYELSYGETDFEGGIYDGALPKQRRQHAEGTARLVHAMAYLQTENHVLEQSSYIDLMPYLTEEGKRLSFRFASREGVWKIFAFYGQPAVQRIRRGGNYVIDHLGRAGVRACEDYWDEILPGMSLDSMEAFFCDSLEYDVAMEWTPDFEQEFKNRRGYDILPYLPVLGTTNTYPLCDIPGYRFDRKEISDMVNHDYMETLTQCYCENHLIPLERMANKYGRTVRYQVAYNRPLEIERCGLYVGIPENEALGAASMDLQKNMAAAAHLGRKERYSFECAAEFGHSYGQSCEDLMWWVKRSLMAGMNAQVLHGASYSGKYTGAASENGQLPGVTWPGYEAFGKLVSNYWNRTLSVRDARGCLDTITRMNMIFRKKAKVDCAVLSSRYGSSENRNEFCNYDDGGALSNHGYSYEFVSEALLQMPVCTVRDGQLDADGPGYRCLIIDTAQELSTALLERVAQLGHAGLAVIWVGRKPSVPKFFSDWNTPKKQKRWKSTLETAWTCENTERVTGRALVPKVLEKMGISPRIRLDGTTDVMTAVREDEKTGISYRILYRYNRAVYSPDTPNPDEVSVSAAYRQGTTKGSYQRPGRGSIKKLPVILSGKGRLVCCDPWSGREYGMPSEADGDTVSACVEMEEDEMLILALLPEEQDELPDRGFHKEPCNARIAFRTLTLYPFLPDRDGETSFLRSGFAQEGQTYRLDVLLPWRLLDPALEHFSGKGVYEGTILVENPEPDAYYTLQLGNLCDTFAVWINGKQTEYPDQVMKRVDVTGMLRQGENSIRVEVVSNLYNALFREGMSEDDQELPYRVKDYGIWEEDGKMVELLKGKKS